MPSPVPAEVLAAFGLVGAEPERHGSGHIHATYRVSCPAGCTLLQRINTTVFADPGRLCGNVARVAKTVHARAPGFVPEPVRSADGALWVSDRSGRSWRALSWIAHARTYDLVPGATVAREVGCAFGRWHRLLADAPLDFEPAIPGFLDLQRRLDELSAARVAASGARLAAAREVLSLADELGSKVRHRFSGRKRLLHADCKVNNVLFDAADRAIAVVDLDTVMAGPLALDFGDLARAASALMAEDEGDPRRVGFDPKRFAALAQGFLAETAALLDPGERAALAHGPAHMAYMLGVRFLADHLRGDRYFPVSRPRQNLDRARAQLHLAAAFARAHDELEALIEAAASG